MLRYLASGHRNFRLWPVPPMPRYNWEFYCVFDGQCGPDFSDRQSPSLQTRTMWVMSPQMTFGWRGDGRDIDRAVFHFASVPVDLAEAAGRKSWLAIPLEDSDIQAIRSLVGELEPHLERPHQYSHLVFERATIDLALIALKRQPIRRDTPLSQIATQRVERAIAWYMINMARSPKIFEVANAVNTTPTHLRRLFKKVRGTSPHDAFRELQIKRACDLLATTQQTLDDIAPQCGFCSTTDFARVFRSNLGTTANTWRRRIVPKNYPEK